MNNQTEDLEDQLLISCAVKSKQSKGRRFQEAPCLLRTCFQRDRDRIIHSKSFRRLRQKTQVFVSTESDHYRSRMTHTLEVAQISRHIARLLRLNEDLAECIALSHDLGHTPFGHSGEKALSQLLQKEGGFEHNRQSLRIIDCLEDKYPGFKGLNLSFEVREGLLKHQTGWDHPKNNGHYVTLEAQVVNLADEIAYNNHDLDDGLASHILIESDLNKNVELWHDAKQAIQHQHPHLTSIQFYHLMNRHLISEQLNDVVQHSLNNIRHLDLKDCEDLQSIKKPIITFSPKMKKKNTDLRHYLYQHFYQHHYVYRMNKKGQSIIQLLFKHYDQDPLLLPISYQQRIKNGELKKIVVGDYIAGMTDHFAIKEAEHLHVFKFE